MTQNNKLNNGYLENIIDLIEGSKYPELQKHIRLTKDEFNQELDFLINKIKEIK